MTQHTTMTAPTVEAAARAAMDLFHRNADTLVAGFLIRHPDVDPGQVTLVMRTTAEGVEFSLKPTKLSVPEARPQSLQLESQDYAYNDGWNDCRAEMLAGARAMLDGAFVAPLESAHG